MPREPKRDEAPAGLWDAEALWAKAVVYAKRAVEEPRDSPWFPFFASLSLEHLGRSVIAGVHPVLLADPRDEENLFYAFQAGRTPRPRSIPAHTLFSRCVRFVPDFTDEMATSCNALAERRNEELHTAALAFGSVAGTAWLPRLYRSLQVLCAARNVELSDLLGDAEAAVAAGLLAAADAETVRDIKDRVGRCRHAAEALSEDERKELLLAPSWPPKRWTRSWELMDCPACKAPARVYGPLARTQAPRLDDNEIVETEIYVRDHFLCAVCGLQLQGHMELDAADIAGSFAEEMRADPDEYYGERYAERYGAMEEDYGND